MKKKTQNISHQPSYSIYPYIVLLVIFICIVYLITLRQRVEEFFTSQNNNAPNENHKIDNIYIKKDINAFEIDKVWEGKMGNGYLSIWQRKNKRTKDLYSLGQFATIQKNTMEALPDTMVKDIPILSFLVKGGKFPLSYIKIWSSDMIQNKNDKVPDFSIWQPVAPEGYIALGDVVVPSLSKPPRTRIVCIPVKDTEPNEQIKTQIFEHNGANPMSIWNIGNYMTFMASSSKEKPTARIKEIVDIKQHVISRHEPDPNEKYKSLQITMKTFS